MLNLLAEFFFVWMDGWMDGGFTMAEADDVLSTIFEQRTSSPLFVSLPAADPTKFDDGPRFDFSTSVFSLFFFKFHDGSVETKILEGFFCEEPMPGRTHLRV